MAYTNAHLRLDLGNVVSHVRGPAPNELLDRMLNPHLQSASPPTGTLRAHVYEARDQSFLTGALPRLVRTLTSHGAPYRVIDRRTTSIPVHQWSLQGVTLRPFQEEVVQKALQAGMGTIDLGTSGGKTILAAAIIARIGLPAVYVVTTRTLLQQAVENLRLYLGIDPGVIGAGMRQPAPLTVAIAQALTNRVEAVGSTADCHLHDASKPAGRTRPEAERPSEVALGQPFGLHRWKNGVLIWDEGHHAAAPSYLDLVKRIDARFNFFLSAVPYRSGDDQVVLDAVTGGTLTDGEYSARYLIENGYACPVDVHIEPIRTRRAMVEQPFWKIYRDGIVRNADRNRRIVEIVGQSESTGESILVLVERIEHGRILKEALEERTLSIGFAHGSQPKTVLHPMTARFAEGDLRCLIATVGLFNEGISIHGITVLVNAGGMKSRGKVLQAVGRGMRQSPSRGKTRCLFVDFYDDDPIGVLRAHSRQRLEVLMDEGFRVPHVEGTDAPAAPEAEATWAHVPGTRNFVKVSSAGQVVARGECLRKELVPTSHCKRCQQPWVCQRGGVTTWQILD